MAAIDKVATNYIIRQNPVIELFRNRGAKTEASSPLSFAAFIDLATNGKYQWYAHCRQLVDVLQRVADDELKRVMIFMPPRHGKSETASRLFGAYYLYRHPERWVGLTSYQADLAYGFSRQARDNYGMVGGKMRDDAYAVKNWETGKGGGLWAAGVGGPITGRGFDLGIIDDPTKNAEEAASERIRRKQNDWYDSTFSTREEPDAAQVIIQTRWNEDDLSGYILGKEIEEPEHWHIVHFEAIKDEQPPEYPPTCTVESDHRHPGDALCPERYPIEKLEKFARRIGAYFFNALFQQRPAPHEGNMLKREWFRIVSGAPITGLSKVRYWDKAGSAGKGAYTCGVLGGISEDKIFYIIDVIRGQWAAPEREKIIKETAHMDGKDVDIYTEQEPGSGGKESADNTVLNLTSEGYVAYADRVTGDKVARSEPFAAHAAAEGVRLVKGDWNQAWINEAVSFPFGAFKDQIDATSGAFNKLPGGNFSDWLRLQL